MSQQKETFMPPPPPQKITPDNIKLLVVFDIDETLIQFISKSNIRVFNDARAELDRKGVEYAMDNNNHVVLFRPYLKEVFELIKSDNFFVPAIWTYSDQEYADNIAAILTEKYGLSENFFKFVWSSDHIDEDYAKNLQQVWAEYPEFNKFNTILVDDRYANMAHTHNKDNGVFIQAFAPFGTEKKREKVVMKRFNDDTFDKLKTFMLAVKEDIQGCEQEDIDGAFFKEGVVFKNRLRRMGFDTNVKKICVNTQDALFIGEHPHDDTRYKIIGGKRKLVTRNKRKPRKQNKSKRNLNLSKR